MNRSERRRQEVLPSRKDSVGKELASSALFGERDLRELIKSRIRIKNGAAVGTGVPS